MVSLFTILHERKLIDRNETLSFNIGPETLSFNVSVLGKSRLFKEKKTHG